MHVPEVVSIGEPLVGIYGKSGKGLKDETAFRRVLGGDTSNFVLALSKLGHSTGYITKIGADPFGQAYRELWAAENVDTTMVAVDPLHPTGLYLTAAADTTHDFIYYRRNSAASSLNSGDIYEGYFQKARVLHVSGISQGISPSARDAVYTALGFAKSRGLEISYDFNYRPALWDQKQARETALDTIRKFVTILCLTREEASLLSSEDDYRKAVPRFLSWGVSLVAVKLGAAGCHLFTEKENILTPAYPVSIVDTVGAGDAFAAAIVCAVLEGMEIEEAARFANLVAALTCRGIGPVQTQPRRKEVDGLLKQNRE
ncbi:MAG: sugar kinase [Firmicutes bacterium]|nr:sugar kinase [Bacillota bacterium]